MIWRAQMDLLCLCVVRLSLERDRALGSIRSIEQSASIFYASMHEIALQRRICINIVGVCRQLRLQYSESVITHHKAVSVEPHQLLAAPGLLSTRGQ